MFDISVNHRDLYVTSARQEAHRIFYNHRAAYRSVSEEYFKSSKDKSSNQINKWIDVYDDSVYILTRAS